MSILYEKIYWPVFEFIKRRQTVKLYKKSLSTQWNDVLSNNQLQMEEFIKLRNYINRYVPFYVDLANSLLPKDASLTDYPVMCKKIIKNEFFRLVTQGKNAGLWMKSTGGSTGVPLHFGYTKESYEWRVAMSKRGYLWARAEPGSRQAYIWGTQLGEVSKLRKFKEDLHHFIDRQLYFNCFDFGPNEMSRCLYRLNRWKPEILVGYTNPLYEFALFVDQRGGPGFKPRSIICAAEKVHDFQREVLEKVFGCPVFNTYGSREFMLIAAECEKHEGLHVSMENLIVEVVDDEGNPVKPGEVGRVLVTDLHNYGMPFIRYEIGDLARLSDRQCSCGRGLMMLDDVIGRQLDVIRRPDGKIVPGEFFPHMMKDFKEVEKFQVVQRELNSLEIKLKLSEEIESDGLVLMERLTRDVVGPDMRLNFMPVDDIPLTPTGKHRVTVSELR
ncbi:MAG: phenylacetate--CoA ligase family protein [Geothermobacteraceae bacterium]